MLCYVELANNVNNQTHHDGTCRGG